MEFMFYSFSWKRFFLTSLTFHSVILIVLNFSFIVVFTRVTYRRHYSFMHFSLEPGGHWNTCSVFKIRSIISVFMACDVFSFLLVFQFSSFFLQPGKARMKSTLRAVHAQSTQAPHVSLLDICHLLCPSVITLITHHRFGVAHSSHHFAWSLISKPHNRSSSLCS
jgi:hypothetical protein